MQKPTCPTSFSRVSASAVFFVAFAWSASAAAEPNASDPAPVANEDAGSLFAEGTTQFKRSAYAEALGVFNRVARLKDSPNVELYIGYCHTELGNDVDAHRAFSLVVRLAIESGDPKYVAAREAAQERLALLNVRLSRLTITLAGGASSESVTLDDAPMDAAQVGSTVVVSPGVHRIVAKSPGRKTVLRDVVLEKGSSKTIAISFEDANAAVETAQRIPLPANVAAAPGAPFTAIGVAAVGIGVVGLGVFAGAGYQTRANYDRLKRECASGCSDTDHADLIGKSKTYQVVANVGLATGVVGVLAGAGLLYWGYTRSERAKPAISVGLERVLVTCEGRF